MKQNEIILSLNKIYDESIDSHSIYTPLDLCEEMINSINSLDGDILVISNLEFLIVLKQKRIDMSKVYYSVGCDIKKQVAVQLGLDINNIYNLDYNKKEVNLGTEENMKFDIVIQNPPYNPNSLWKNFVLMGIECLKDDGQMVAIHPIGWRESTNHKKLYNILISGMKEFHSCDAEIWKEQKVAMKIDWYLYDKSGSNTTKCYYSNGDYEEINLKNIDRLLRFSTNSIPYSILKKITKENYDNGIIIINTGFASSIHIDNGKYKQCGGIGNGTGWTMGNYVLTDEPTKHQFKNKVVMSYAGKPRAQHFSKSEEIGVGKALYWLTDNQSLPILLNSKLLLKIAEHIYFPDKGMYRYGGLQGIPMWFLKSLNFDELEATNEQELYEHYGLTEEEINWIENE